MTSPAGLPVSPLARRASPYAAWPPGVREAIGAYATFLPPQDDDDGQRTTTSTRSKSIFIATSRRSSSQEQKQHNIAKHIYNDNYKQIGLSTTSPTLCCDWVYP